MKELFAYINFYPENINKLFFVKPVFKEGKKKYWLDFTESSNNELLHDFVALESGYENNLDYKLSNIINQTEINISVPEEPLFMLNIANDLFFGATIEILQALFGKNGYDINKIKEYDKDYLLIRFMIRNYDNKYMRQYLNSFSKKERIQIIIKILNTHKLQKKHKKNFIEYISMPEEEHGNYDQLNLFKNFRAIDKEKLKREVVDVHLLHKLFNSIDEAAKEIDADIYMEKREWQTSRINEFIEAFNMNAEIIEKKETIELKNYA